VMTIPPHRGAPARAEKALTWGKDRDLPHAGRRPVACSAATEHECFCSFHPHMNGKVIVVSGTG
jgi:hypothetical protein